MPRSAGEVGEAEVLALRKGLPWEKATFAIHFAALRQFLRWAHNPIAETPGVWRLPSGQPSRRRWLTARQFAALYAASEGRARLLVALEGLNGLRRVELLRLRKKDVLLDEACLKILGKGRDGGKWRKIPIHPVVEPLATAHVSGLRDDDRLFPLSRSGADGLLATASAAAGFPAEGIRVSHHDLRRTFGRIAHQSGMDLIQLKNLLGHNSVEMTVHYIGLDAEEMRRGLGLVKLGAVPRIGPRALDRGSNSLRPTPR